PGDTAHALKPSSPSKSRCRAPGSAAPARACGTARGTYRPLASAGCSASSSWHGRPADSSAAGRGRGPRTDTRVGNPQRSRGAGGRALLRGPGRGKGSHEGFLLAPLPPPRPPVVDNLSDQLAGEENAKGEKKT